MRQPQALLSLLLLTLDLLSPVLAKPPCPAQAPCQCTDLRIKCIQLDATAGNSDPHEPPPLLHYLSAVPYFAPASTGTRWSYAFHELRIRGQAMTGLSLAFDWGAISVSRVEVTTSLVRRLLPGAFNGLSGVKSLNLSHNLLATVDASDLRDLTSLEELVLHNNLIKMLHPSALASNGLISRLYLSHNLLSEIPPGLKRLTHLTHLYLQFNNISQVPERAFAGLRRLIILDLGSLRAGLDINSGAFCGLFDGLVALYLRGNILRGLDLCALGRARALRGLNLTGSFFPCSCHAASFADRSDWRRRYGFAPLYVTYEAGLLASCQPANCPDRPPACPDYCRGVAASADPPAPAVPRRSASGGGGGALRAEIAASATTDGRGATPAALMLLPLLMMLLVQCIAVQLHSV